MPTPAAHLPDRLAPAHGLGGREQQPGNLLRGSDTWAADTFTFAARDGFADSNLGTGTVRGRRRRCSPSPPWHMWPANWPAGWPAPAFAVVTPSNTTSTVAYDWDSVTARRTAPTPLPATPTQRRHLLLDLDRARFHGQATVTGSIAVSGMMRLNAASADNLVTLAWPKTDADAWWNRRRICPHALDSGHQRRAGRLRNPPNHRAQSRR